MWGHRFFAVADALAHHKGTDQTSHCCIDVHNSAACKVQGTHLPDVAGLAVHRVNNFLAGVGIRAHPEPHHVRYRQITEGKPQRHERQNSRKLHPLGKGSNDQCAGDTGKRGLKRGKNDFWNDNTFAERGSIGKRARCVVPNAPHEQPIKAAKKGVAFCKSDAVAVQHPQHNDHGKRHHDLHQNRQHVLAAHQAAIKQRQAGNRHHEDQQRG